MTDFPKISKNEARELVATANGSRYMTFMVTYRPFEEKRYFWLFLADFFFAKIANLHEISKNEIRELVSTANGSQYMTFIVKYRPFEEKRYFRLLLADFNQKYLFRTQRCLFGSRDQASSYLFRPQRCLFRSLICLFRSLRFCF